jgi:hypothetical protein
VLSAEAMTKKLLFYQEKLVEELQTTLSAYLNPQIPKPTDPAMWCRRCTI